MKLTNFWHGPAVLMLEPLKGKNIRGCIDEARSLAETLHMPVGFIFNDLFLLAEPGGESTDEMLKRWSEGRSSRIVPWPRIGAGGDR